MKKIIKICLLVGSMFSYSGCSESFFERQDKKTVESQLHLPKHFKYLSFESYPRWWGWFGREGLWIRAEIEFSEDEFAAYVNNLDNSAVWKPVKFNSYSPSIGESYSADALKWRNLPLPAAIKSEFRENCALTPDLIHSENGKYYCSTIVFLQVYPPSQEEHKPDHFRASGWRYVGRACDELEVKDNATIKTLAILDFDTRRMSVYIQFSG
jgi:hypothetical protein